ncbi:MAG TPA: Signal peptidase-like protein, partial [Cyclobacteriaceae bacterium]|nr:Signal peptidase-like protein [Cyclobacteriaceae bacterium]
LQDIPKIETPLLTEAGEARLQKTDIFRKIMWFGFNEENTWYPLNVARVNQILELNRAGKKPANLQDDVLAEKIPVQKLNSDLTQMDEKFRDKSKKKKKKKKGNRDNRPQGDGNQNANRPKQQGQNPNRNQSQQPNRNQNPNQQNRNPGHNRNQPQGENRNQNRNQNRNRNHPNRNQNNPNRNDHPGSDQPRNDS